MKRLWLLLAAAAVLCAAPAIHRASLTSSEKNFDRAISRIAEDPYLLVGLTRGLYLEGYGAVFTAEVSLANFSISPFRPALSKEDLAKIRELKLARLPILRQRMRETLLDAAASLDDVPAKEQIVLGVTLLYRAEEDASGMPAQILMQGERAGLVAAKLGKAQPDAVIKVREF